jgi:hypothetical protein
MDIKELIEYCKKYKDTIITIYPLSNYNSNEMNNLKSSKCKNIKFDKIMDCGEKIEGVIYKYHNLEKKIMNEKTSYFQKKHINLINTNPLIIHESITPINPNQFPTLNTYDSENNYKGIMYNKNNINILIINDIIQISFNTSDMIDINILNDIITQITKKE